MIDFTVLHELLTYDSANGELRWKTRRRDLFRTQRAFIQWNSRYAGKIAGTLKVDSGYVIVSIHKQLFRAHRIVWCLATGKWPVSDIDHINGVRSDNRLGNLRSVQRAENAKNKRLLPTNKTGYHGVSVASHGKYRAKGCVGSVQKHLGYFGTLEAAVIARRNFEAANGFHINHGVAA